MWRHFFRKIFEKLFCRNFFFNFFFLMGGGFQPPAPPTGAAPLDPSCFWFEDSSQNMFALNGISAINPTIFYEHFFFLNKKIILKSSKTCVKKCSFNSDKKKMLRQKKIRKNFQHLKKKKILYALFSSF